MEILQTVARKILDFFWPEDLATKAFEDGAEAFTLYRTSNKKTDLDTAITNFSTSLDLRLQRRNEWAADSRPVAEDKVQTLSTSIADTYLNYIIALLDRYWKFGNGKVDAEQLMKLEESLFKEWDQRCPPGYAGVTFNLGNVYCQLYRNIVLEPSPAAYTVIDDKEAMFQKLRAMYERLIYLKDGEGGQTQDIKRMSLIALSKMFVLKYTSSSTLRSSDAGSKKLLLSDAINYLEQALKLFQPPITSLSPALQAEYRDCNDNLATAYFMRYEAGAGGSNAANASDPQYLNKAIELFSASQKMYSEDPRSPPAIRCAHNLARALYKRYESLQSYPRPTRIAGNRSVRVKAGLDDLKEAERLEKQVKSAFDSLGEEQTERMKLEDVKRDVMLLLAVIAQQV